MLQLQKKDGIFKYIFIFIFFTIETVPDFRTSSIVWWACIAGLCIVFIFDSYNREGNIILQIKPFEKWYILFTGYAVSSIVWASSRSNTWAYIPTIIITLLICTIISQMIRSEEDLDAILFARYLSSVVLCLYIYTNIDLSVLGNERIGTYVLGEGWNSNGIAFKLTIGCILGIDQMRSISNRLAKMLVFASVVGMFIIMMFCGSRTAFLIAVAGILGYLWLTYKNKWVIMTCLIVVAVIAIYNVVMNVPELYNVLGYRLEILGDSLAGDTQAGSGTELRLTMMTEGLKVFLQNPIIGVGMNNFRNVFGNMSGVYKYSHCNHTEMLSDFGIIGFILYYSSFVRLGAQGMRQFFKKESLDKIHVLTLCTVLILIISGFGTIYYMQTNETLLLAVCFSGLYLQQEKEENTYYSDE